MPLMFSCRLRTPSFHFVHVHGCHWLLLLNGHASCRLTAGVLMILPVLPLTERGAVVDFVAACTLTHRHPTTVHTHLINDDLCEVRASLGFRVVRLLKRDLVLK